MTYLPKQPLNPEKFPQPGGDDLETAIQIINERWKRFYTLVDYYPLKKSVTLAVNNMVGALGTTGFDRLWGESIDPAMLTDGEWTQPIGSNGAYKVGDVELYQQPVRIPLQIKRTARKDELQRWGFDRVRTVIAIIPVSLLDAYNITVSPGDYFFWNGEQTVVLQNTEDGQWKNTNIFLYEITNCVTRNRGG